MGVFAWAVRRGSRHKDEAFYQSIHGITPNPLQKAGCGVFWCSGDSVSLQMSLFPTDSTNLTDLTFMIEVLQ